MGKKLEGKIALITGASKGIGRGIAETYAKHGASLIVAARSSSEIEEFAGKLRADGYNALGIAMDVSNPESVKEGVKKALIQFETIDILVNNAGVCRLGNFLDLSDEDRDYHIDINLKGVWNVTKCVMPLMVKKNRGKIVIMSSVTGDMVADPGEVAYAMTKAALVGFTKALAVEAAKNNINVNAICPGYILTPMVQGMAKQSDSANPDSVINGVAGAIPFKRMGKPVEVGELAAFLGSDEASYITGTQIVIDGGSTLPETASVGV
jgi:NAD(P)-dependent dehydrogenase (short-subunit alcohol dehydrogenase family)